MTTDVLGALDGFERAESKTLVFNTASILLKEKDYKDRTELFEIASEVINSFLSQLETLVQEPGFCVEIFNCNHRGILMKL